LTVLTRPGDTVPVRAALPPRRPLDAFALNVLLPTAPPPSADDITRFAPEPGHDVFQSSFPDHCCAAM
jgi:hypothetical protein